MLHAWDYDLVSVKRDWDRICRLKPVPATGTAHWNRNDSYLLEQIHYRYPDEWKSVAGHALTAHALRDIEERVFFLKGAGNAPSRRSMQPGAQSPERPGNHQVPRLDVGAMQDHQAKRQRLTEGIRNHNQTVN